jgi:hypothetical protein
MPNREQDIPHGDFVEIVDEDEIYSCTCDDWQNQDVLKERRTCQHLRRYRGDDVEERRTNPSVRQISNRSRPLPLFTYVYLVCNGTKGHIVDVLPNGSYVVSLDGIGEVEVKREDLVPRKRGER